MPIPEDQLERQLPVQSTQPNPRPRVSESGSDWLPVSRGLERAIRVHAHDRLKGISGEIISLLRCLNDGKQVKGTAAVVRVGLQLDCRRCRRLELDCRRLRLEYPWEIGVLVCFKQEKLAELAGMYSRVVELGIHVDAICRQGPSVPNFAVGGVPEIVVVDGVAYLAEEIEV